MSLSPPPTQSTIAYYQRLRRLGPKLMEALGKKLSKLDLHEGAKALGILKGNTLIFNDIQESSVLVDYCLLFPSGKKSVTVREIERGGYSPDSDEMRILEAMQQAYYSLFILEYGDGNGFSTLSDLLARVNYGLIDVGLSQTPQKILMAGNILPLPGTEYWMTSGAMLPVVGENVGEEVLRIADKFLPSVVQKLRLSRSQQKVLAKQVTRFLLRNNIFSQVEMRSPP